MNAQQYLNHISAKKYLNRKQAQYRAERNAENMQGLAGLAGLIAVVTLFLVFIAN